MFTINDRVPAHRAQGQGRRRNVDSEWEKFWASVAGPVRTQSGGHESHATGGVRQEGKEGQKNPHEPEHVIWPSVRAVYQLSEVMYWGAGDMENDVERAETAKTTKNYWFLGTNIRQRHGVSPCTVSYAPLSLHVMLSGGLQQLGVQTML